MPITLFCQQKSFKYNGEQTSVISAVDIINRDHTTTMILTFPLDRKKDVVKALLSEQDILTFFEKMYYTLAEKLTRIEIHAPLYDMEKIKKSLKILEKHSLINKDFAKDISTNYPNGHGGTMSLNDRCGIEMRIGWELMPKDLNDLKGLLKKAEDDNECQTKPGAFNTN